MTDRRISGVTLIELILVMALMLMVMAMVAPRLDGFSRRRVLAGHADVVLAMLNTARDRAAAEAVCYRFEVDPDDGSCRLYRQSGGRFEPLPDRPDGRHVLPDGIAASIEMSGQEQAGFVEFKPTGRCTPAVIRLTDDGRPPVLLTARTPLEPFRMIQNDRETQ